MTDLFLSARPVTQADMRVVPVGKEADQTVLQDPGGDMPPVQAPDELQRSDLQPLPLPERRPLVIFGAGDEAEPPLSLTVGPSEAMSAFTVQKPSRVDPMSLFQGLLAQAAQTGARAPGTSARLYALVQQIYSVMEGAQENAVY